MMAEEFKYEEHYDDIIIPQKYYYLMQRLCTKEDIEKIRRKMEDRYPVPPLFPHLNEIFRQNEQI